MALGVELIGMVSQITSTIWNSLSSYYRFSEISGTSAADAIGGKTGTATAGVGWVSTGINGYCISLSGTTHRVDIGNNYAFERTDSFSIATWHKRSNTTGAYWYIFAKGLSSGTYRGYSLFFNGNNTITATLTSDSSGNNLEIVTTEAFSGTTSWYYIVMTYAGTSAPSGLKIYINAVDKETSTVSNNLTSTIVTTSVFNIGNRDGNNNCEKGLYDEFGIWSRVLTQAEITELYNGGSGKFY